MNSTSRFALSRLRRCIRLRRPAGLALCIGFLGFAASAGALLSRDSQSPNQQSAPGRSLTVERIYGSPSLSDALASGIEWSPDGKRLSYFARGADDSLELWAMDAATGKRLVLVDGKTLDEVMQPEKSPAVQATGLGRLDEENYLWSPDSGELLFVGSNDLVLLDLTTMHPKPLVHSNAELEDPKFSPDGKWVSYVRGYNLWAVSVTTAESKALTTGGREDLLKGKLDWVYPEELDVSTAYWWSPDSSRIAYFEMDEKPVTRYPIVDMSSPSGALEYTRFPQAGEPNPIVRVGVAPIGGGSTTWMDTGTDTDIYPARVKWLQDSRRVAIERLNRAQNRLDLLFCDAATGTSQSILTETDKYWINISDDLYFFADDKRFLWSSERTGFRHFYLYDLSGRQLEQLTTGDWTITASSGFGPGAADHPEVDEAHDCVYFLSNKDDVHDQQLYRLSLKDRSIARITPAAGTHDVLIAPDYAGFVDTFSDAMTPPRQDLDDSSGNRIASIGEKSASELPSYHLSPVQFVNVLANDGTTLSASMIKPPDFDPSRKYPVLIDVYGGSQVQTVVNAWGGVDFLWLEMMAQKGYIVFALDNRGSYNRGHAFETPIYHQFGKVELQDQLSGVNYLKSLPYVDGSRIGIWGWSYGAYMTLDALCNAPDVFKAGIAVAPVTDWRLYDTIYTERYMGRPQDNPEGYASASVAASAANMKGKLMLAHGTGDDNVHFANTSELLNNFIHAGRYPTDVMIFPGRGHAIADRSARIDLFNRMTAFLLNNL